MLQSKSVSSNKSLAHYVLFAKQNVVENVSCTKQGLLADSIGRRPTLTTAVIMGSMCQALGAIMPTYEWYVVTRALAGIGANGLFVIAYMLNVEVSDSSKAAAVGNSMQVPFAGQQPFIKVCQEEKHNKT